MKNIVSHPVTSRLAFLLRLYVTLLLIFATQKVVFIICNLVYSNGMTFDDWLAVVWHGLSLDSVTACYILWIPWLMLLVSLFFSAFNFRKALLPYYVFVALLMAVAFVADLVMYRFWGVKIDSNDLMYATHPKDMLASVTWWEILLGVVVLTLLTWHYARRLRHATPVAPLARPSYWSLLLFLPLAGVLFLGIRGGVGASVANPSYAYFSSRSFLNHAALNPLFNMVHSMPKTEDFASEFQFYDDAVVDGVRSSCYYSDTILSDTLLRTSRPDILLVIWEGGGSAMVCNDSVAPNLMALAREGVYFDRCYANSYRTDRGLVSLFSGWSGLPTASLMKMSDMCRKLPAFPRVLRQAGYATTLRYGGDIDFTNMRGYLYEMGFDQVEGNEAFPESRSLSSWGAPDAYLLQASSLPQQSPFFAAWLTLSSHEPWQVPIRRLADDRKNSFAYTDSCLGALVRELRQSPRWDNLLLIVVSDHGVAVDASQTTASAEVAAIPIVWAGGAVRHPLTVHRLMNQSDLAATLLAQLHLPVNSLTFSRNVLSPSYDSCYPVALHAFKNGLNCFDTVGHVAFDCVSLQPTAWHCATTSSHRFDLDTTTDDESHNARLQRAKALLQLVFRTTGQLKLVEEKHQ